MPPRSEKAQRWAFTVQRDNDPCLLPFVGDDAIVGVLEWKENYRLPANVALLACQFERVNRLHVQGYIELVRAVDMQVLKNMTDVWGLSAGSGVHLEVARGSREDNLTYVSKVETRVPGTVAFLREDKDKMEQVRDAGKKRSRKEDAERAETQLRWINTTNKVLRKAADEDIVIENLPFWIGRLAEATVDPEEKVEVAKVAANVLRSMRTYEPILESFKQEARRTRMALNRTIEVRDVQVHYWWGGPGTSKSTTAYLNYSHYGIYSVVRGMQFFDGYKPDQHGVLLIDDFSGGEDEKFLTPSRMQDLLQGLPLMLNVKGKSPVEARYYIVIITSNLHFDELYNRWTGVPPAVKDSIRSRVTFFKEFVGPDRRQHARHTCTPYRPVEVQLVKTRLQCEGHDGGATGMPAAPGENAASAN